ncbi:MAG: hypothetical protein ACK5Y2_07980 [Bdellovibrionales bacterium]
MTLTELLKIPDEKRDYNWENHFFDELLKSKVKLLDEGPQTGPDNWPYLLVETSDEAEEPALNIVKWLSDKGIGLVVNPRKEYPDYVFPWGMIWNFRETGLFRVHAAPIQEGAIELQTEKGLHAGPPSLEYLPDYVRKLLRQFFMDQGLMQVRILVLSQDRKHYDLAFSLESLGNPPKHEHAGIAEAISWFLPNHYSVLLTSEKDLPSFVAL